MTDVFTASNGVTVEMPDPLELGLRPVVVGGGDVWLHASDIRALREFFQHETDTRLNRWRSKEHPEYVVYEKHSVISVLDEARNGRRDFRDVAHAVRANTTYADVAVEYFTAHPVTPPPAWHEAKEGEVWALTFGARKPDSWFVNGAYFQNTRTFTNVRVTDDTITTAHRIWPPVETEESAA